MFANPPFPVGITACRPIYSPSTGALLGVAGLDFLLTAVEQLIISFVPTTIDTIVYILDGTSEQMIASSILGISTNEFGQVNVLECGVPEIEVFTVQRCVHISPSFLLVLTQVSIHPSNSTHIRSPCPSCSRSLKMI